MIDRQHGVIAFECDACDEVLATSEEDWAPAQAQFRARGWRAEKIGDEWVHLCPGFRKRA